MIRLLGIGPGGAPALRAPGVLGGPRVAAAATSPTGTVVARGFNGSGVAAVPKAALSGVTAIAGGDSHSLALLSDGAVVGWGYNDNGQTTVPAGLSGVTAIAGGGSHSLALVAPATDLVVSRA